jgi:hypothetical protein
VRSEFCHVYYKPGRYAGCRFMFSFSASSPHLRDPDSGPGRPKGVFNAECWGTTVASDPAYRGHVKPFVDRDHEQGADRFPLADSFTTREEAALECDFWKLILQKKYYLTLPYSHGSLQAFLDAAMSKGLDPLHRLTDEYLWTEELNDFLSAHSVLLDQHREAAKPDFDLDDFESWGKKNNSIRIVHWCGDVRRAQRELESFSSSNPGMEIKRLRIFQKRVRELVSGTCVPNFASLMESLEAKHKIEELRYLIKKSEQCELLLINRKLELERALEQLMSNRPPLIPGDIKITQWDNT